MARTITRNRNGFVHGARVVSAFALAGAVVSSLALGWIPALAALDMHAVGAGVGAVLGLVANARHAV